MPMLIDVSRRLDTMETQFPRNPSLLTSVTFRSPATILTWTAPFISWVCFLPTFHGFWLWPSFYSWPVLFSLPIQTMYLGFTNHFTKPHNNSGIYPWPWHCSWAASHLTENSCSTFLPRPYTKISNSSYPKLNTCSSFYELPSSMYLSLSMM